MFWSENRVHTAEQNLSSGAAPQPQRPWVSLPRCVRKRRSESSTKITGAWIRSKDQVPAEATPPPYQRMMTPFQINEGGSEREGWREKGRIRQREKQEGMEREEGGGLKRDEERETGRKRGRGTETRRGGGGGRLTPTAVQQRHKREQEVLTSLPVQLPVFPPRPSILRGWNDRFSLPRRFHVSMGAAASRRKNLRNDAISSVAAKVR